MKKYILCGGMSLFICLYSHAQPDANRLDEIGYNEINASELFINSSLPVNGAVNGFHSEGKIRYSGSVKNSRLHGHWESWYDNHTLHDEGKLVKGIPDGQWKVW